MDLSALFQPSLLNSSRTIDATQLLIESQFELISSIQSSQNQSQAPFIVNSLENMLVERLISVNQKVRNSRLVDTLERIYSHTASDARALVTIDNGLVVVDDLIKYLTDWNATFNGIPRGFGVLYFAFEANNQAFQELTSGLHNLNTALKKFYNIQAFNINSSFVCEDAVSFENKYLPSAAISVLQTQTQNK
jgi:hypothetical protein